MTFKSTTERSVADIATELVSALVRSVASASRTVDRESVPVPQENTGRSEPTREGAHGGYHYIVQSAYVRMPGDCWGSYRRVAVLEVDTGVQKISMISARARGCRRVVAVWERRHAGSTDRCAYSCALVAAEELAAQLNAGADIASAVRMCGADCILPDANELNLSLGLNRSIRADMAEMASRSRTPSRAEVSRTSRRSRIAA